MQNLLKVLLVSTVLVGSSWMVNAETMPCAKYDSASVAAFKPWP